MTFASQRTIFIFLVMVYDRMCGGDKRLCETFGLGRPRFHATSHLTTKAKQFFMNPK